uniref:Uncharacterized protein n=1 Tax=Plectus sambesii TaxID=2011161 RepID=A0A914WGF9_9BILA
MMQQESHPAEAVVVNEPDAGQPGAYFVDPTCPSPVSISPSRVSQPPASWLEEVSAALQAIRACAVACQSSDRGRQRISDAVDDLWDICDKARRDVKVEKQRILQTS